MADSIRVAAEQARVALDDATSMLANFEGHHLNSEGAVTQQVSECRAALASLEAALAALPGDKGQGDCIDEAQFLRDFERNMNACHPAAPILDQVPPIAGRDGASAAPSDEGSAWQPYLDSLLPAPGTEVLLWTVEDFWDDEQHVVRGAVHMGDCHAAHPEGGSAYLSDYMDTAHSHITHWMPLPAPPRQVAHSSQAQGELSVGPVVTNNDRMNEENQNG